MNENREAQILQLTLHGHLIGYLVGFKNGRNVVSFADSFTNNPERPTLGLITRPDFPSVEKLLASPWSRQQRLHPILSNLLPEGALRELLAQNLKIHQDNEFQLFSYLGQDLPGALIATPMKPDDVPPYLLGQKNAVKAISICPAATRHFFSLAGIQMKFSMKEKDGRYHIARSGTLGDWIIKTPSTRHPHVPLNEYTAMSLAKLAGVDIPDIRLIDLTDLDNLPPINLPNERQAFAIRRFDRQSDTRIHMEDFAQVLVKYPHEKYNAANYEKIGKVVYQYTGDGLTNAQQMARRLLVNILLANGDAHLKNWSLFYPDQITPELSPAYDIVTTHVYMSDETQYALNMGNTKEWYRVSLEHFEAWAQRADIPWRAIKPHLDDTLEKARTLWPKALNELPMNDAHKTQLIAHWQRLQNDFQIIPPLSR